jgi:hypothetical protein
VSTPAKAAALEAWHRMRTDIEDRIRDAKHGAALRHLPSGVPVLLPAQPGPAFEVVGGQQPVEAGRDVARARPPHLARTGRQRRDGHRRQPRLHPDHSTL